MPLPLSTGPVPSLHASLRSVPMSRARGRWRPYWVAAVAAGLLGGVPRLARLRTVESAKHGPTRHGTGCGRRRTGGDSRRGRSPSDTSTLSAESPARPPIPMATRPRSRPASTCRSRGAAFAAGGCASRTRSGALHRADDLTACRRARLQRRCESARTLSVTRESVMPPISIIPSEPHSVMFRRATLGYDACGLARFSNRRAARCGSRVRP